MNNLHSKKRQQMNRSALPPWSPYRALQRRLESCSERILKIGQHLAKLRATEWQLLTHTWQTDQYFLHHPIQYVT